MAKPLDLSVRQPMPHASVPSFHLRNHTSGSLTGSGTQDVFNPKGAVTVQWTFIQVSAACTVQLLENSVPVSAVISLLPGGAVRFAGQLLANNAKLSLSLSTSVTVTYDVAWSKEFCDDLIVRDTAVYPNGSVINSPRKTTIIEATSLLGNGGVFTGPWRDTNLDGTAFVEACSVSAQASAANGFVIQEADDTTNATFIKNVMVFSALTSGAPNRVWGTIKARYWRVVYTNGVTIQTTFELTTTALTFVPFNNATDYGIAANIPGPFVGIMLPGSASSFADNLANIDEIFTNTVGTGGPLRVFPGVYGGAFSGTAQAALQSWSKPRTPTVFRAVSTAATGSTAIWTANTNNKWRLLKYRVQVTALAKAAVAADLVIKLLDVALDLNLQVLCTIPAAPAGNGVILDTGWQDLGQFGILAAAVTTALNVNLSFALTGGLVNVLVCGTEE